jgi:hypothetical protein
VDSLLAHLRDSYTRDFRLADNAFYSGRLEATSHGREKYWKHWQKYLAPVGVDPYLQGTNFQKWIQLLSGFAAQVRTGFYGNGKQVKNCTVSSTITAVGQTIALACDSNPTKVVGSECLLPCLQIMLDGYRKVDLATRKKLPVQSDVSELLVETAYQQGTTQRQGAAADLTMIAFYNLLRVGEYTIIGSTGKSTWLLWEWTLTLRVPKSKNGSNSYPVSQHKSEQAFMVMENKLKIAQSVARLRPLGRQSRWPVTSILPKL